MNSNDNDCNNNITNDNSRLLIGNKVGNHSQRWPKGSLFNSYYTKV